MKGTSKKSKDISMYYNKITHWAGILTASSTISWCAKNQINVTVSAFIGCILAPYVDMVTQIFAIFPHPRVM